MEDFEGLEAWKLARSIRNEIRNIVKKFPEEEKYRLTDQIVRSSRSVTANIAEGYGRFNYQENIRFCRIARGSITETIDHMICALDCSYISEEEYAMVREKIAENIRVLNGYINYLRRTKKG